MSGLKKIELLDESKNTDVKTVYKHRCLLRRLKEDGEAPEWIVRGKGDLSIVQSLTTSRVHMYMHMEQTERTCLNANIIPTMEMHPNSASDRSWLFFTTDYADFDKPGQAIEGKFAVTFKTPEIAQKFKDTFDTLKLHNAGEPKPLVEADTKAEETKAEETKAEETKTEETAEATPEAEAAAEAATEAATAALKKLNVEEAAAAPAEEAAPAPTPEA